MPDDLTIRLGLDASGFLNGINTVERNTQSFSASLSSMATTVQRQIESGFSIMTRLDLVQITMEQSARRVTDAQEKYNQALMEFGAGSKQAIAANKELTNATEAQEKAQLRARMSHVMVAGDLLAMSTRLPQVVAGIQAMGVAALSTARNLTVMQVAGGAAVAVLAGLAAASVMFKEDVERGTTALEELRLAEENMAKHGEPVSAGWIGDHVRKAADLVIPGTSLDNYREAVERLDAAQKAYNQENFYENLRRSQQASIDAAKAAAELEQRNTSLASSMRQGFGTLGIEVAAFSQAFQDDLLIAAGVSEEFVAKMRPLVDVETMLKNAAGEAGKALRAQAEITARKDETTEDFIARLKELGFTEEEIAERVDETGRALRRQADATTSASVALTRLSDVEAAQAAARASGAGGARTTQSKSASMNGWAMGAPQERPPSLAEFITDNARAILSSFLGTTSDRALNTMAFDPQGVASYLMSGDSGIGVKGVGAYVGGGAGSPQFVRFVNALKTQIVKSLPSNQWDSLLGQLGVNGYAHGVSGTITRPGLFYAGEHGSESIQIRPNALGDEKSGGAGTTVIVQPGAIVLNGQRADDLIRHLRRAGLNA